MTIRFKQKIRKQRGHRSHGWGGKKKHRGKGSTGGKGYAGSTKHKRSWISRFEPDHLGKFGFVSLGRKEKTINVSELEKLNKNDIDLTALGYDKLLAKGNIKNSITVKVKKFSKRAKEKIEKAGGKIIAE